MKKRFFITAAINICILTFFLLGASAQDGNERFIPDRFDGCGGFTLEDTHRTFTRENMYEHVNGEAELLKRYGATGLAYASYSSQTGDSVTVDLIDMDRSDSAYGLYRLYTGCEEGVRETRNDRFAIFLSETTSFAVGGNIFLRINIFDENLRCPDLPIRVADRIFLSRDSDPPIPAVARVLEKYAGRECDVAYYPDEVDFERGLGPGYRWVGNGGLIYHLKVCRSGVEAEQLYTRIWREEGMESIVMGNVLAWTAADRNERKGYLLRVVRDVIKAREKTMGGPR